MRLTPAPMPGYMRVTLADLLRTRREQILATWRLHTGISRERAAAVLQRISSSEDAAVGDEDGEVERRVVEYQALRRIVTELNAKDGRGLPFEELRRLDDWIDRAVLAAIARGHHEVEALRASEARLRSMFDHSPAAMFIKDADGRFVMANRSCAALLGGEPEAIVGRLEQEIVPADAASVHLENDRRALEGGGPIEIEESLLFEGERRRFLSIKFAAEEPSERPLVCGIATDITDRERAEQGQRFLVEAGRMLGASLDFEETLLRVVRLAATNLADACVIDLVDGQEVRRTGFSQDPSKEQVIHEFIAVGPPPMDSMRPMAIAMRTRATLLIPVHEDGSCDDYEIPDRVRTALRELGIQSVIVSPLIGRTGVLGAVAIGACERRYGPHDLAIAEGLARIAADAIENARLYREAREATQSREDVLAIVSHDLRSPLAAVGAATQMLARCIAPEDACTKHIEIARRATQRMDRLIGDLLQAAAIRTGRMVVTRRPEPLAQILGEAFDTHASIAKQRGITLGCELAAKGVEVSCDRDRIVQVISNLLGNALKFCRPGDTITLGADVSEREIRVFVSDTGPGIDEDDLAHLFDPYWSARRHRSAGTGLGLYICKGLVEAHDGRIGVESRIGKGSTVWFTLPRAA